MLTFKCIKKNLKSRGIKSGAFFLFMLVSPHYFVYFDPDGSVQDLQH
jgi:hypothetical protein